jgi:hypothetical protein
MMPSLKCKMEEARYAITSTFLHISTTSPHVHLVTKACCNEQNVNQHPYPYHSDQLPLLAHPPRKFLREDSLEVLLDAKKCNVNQRPIVSSQFIHATTIIAA